MIVGAVAARKMRPTFVGDSSHTSCRRSGTDGSVLDVSTASNSVVCFTYGCNYHPASSMSAVINRLGADIPINQSQHEDCDRATSKTEFTPDAPCGQTRNGFLSL